MKIERMANRHKLDESNQHNFNKDFFKMKKWLVGLGTAFASVLAFAEETSGTSSTEIVSVSDMTDMFTTAQTNMASLIDAAIPVAISFVVGGLVIWGAIALVGILKRAFTSGKGR